jgi:hypothetical protein
LFFDGVMVLAAGSVLQDRWTSAASTLLRSKSADDFQQIPKYPLLQWRLGLSSGLCH